MKKSGFLFLFVLLSSSSLAQYGYIYLKKFNKAKFTIELRDGDPQKLRGIHNVNIRYEYDAERIEGTDENKKRIRKNQHDWRIKTFEPGFEYFFNTCAGRTGIQGKNHDTLNQVTLLVRITKIDLGYNQILERQPAYLDAEFFFLDSKNETLAYYFIRNIPGSSSVPVKLRVKHGYRKAGKLLGKRIGKDLES